MTEPWLEEGWSIQGSNHAGVFIYKVAVQGEKDVWVELSSYIFILILEELRSCFIIS